MRFRLRLFMKVALLMVGLATIPLSLVGVQILVKNREALQYEVLRHHTGMAESMAEKLDGHLAVLEEKLRFAVGSLRSEKMAWTEKQSLLQALVDSSPSFAVIAVVSQDGSEFVKVYN